MLRIQRCLPCIERKWFFSDAEAHARKLNVDMYALWLKTSARSYGHRTRIESHLKCDTLSSPTHFFSFTFPQLPMLLNVEHSLYATLWMCVVVLRLSTSPSTNTDASVTEKTSYENWTIIHNVRCVNNNNYNYIIIQLIRNAIYSVLSTFRVHSINFDRLLYHVQSSCQWG